MENYNNFIMKTKKSMSVFVGKGNPTYASVRIIAGRVVKTYKRS